MMISREQFWAAFRVSGRVPEMAKQILEMAWEQGCSLTELENAMNVVSYAARAGLQSSAPALSDARAESMRLIDGTSHRFRNYSERRGSSVRSGSSPCQSEISGMNGACLERTSSTSSGEPVQPSE